MRCNALQRKATRYNALQRAATVLQRRFESECVE